MSKATEATPKKGATAWDQLKGEPDVAYARFLIYLHLGRGRTIHAAAALLGGKKGKRKQRSAGAPGQWTSDSSEFNWRARASAWDVWMLTEAGKNCVTQFVNVLERATLKTLKVLGDPKAKPRGWAGVLESIRTLSLLIPPETIVALMQREADEEKAGPESEPEGGDHAT